MAGGLGAIPTTIIKTKAISDIDNQISEITNNPTNKKVR